MNQPTVDLHTHSTASDGTSTPTELVQSAVAAGLVGLALTDHDTGNGLLEAVGEAKKLNLKFVPGIEISAEFPDPGTLHILGHYINPQSPALKEMSTILLEGRNARNPQIVKRLNELGCTITMEQVQNNAKKGVPPGAPFVVGRPHIAATLVENGCVPSIKAAFDQYLGSTGAAFFPKERLTPRQAMDCIHKAGGLATLAHPVQLKCKSPEELQTVVNRLVEAGLDGIEAWHSDHTERDTEIILQLAKRYNLVVTGGSDFHGKKKADVFLGRGRNNVKVQPEVLTNLEARWKSRFAPAA